MNAEYGFLAQKFIDINFYHNFHSQHKQEQNFNFLLKVKIKIGHGAIFNFH